MIDVERIVARQGQLPRYTSYPTAPHFLASEAAAADDAAFAAIGPRDRLSLYIHIPYCDRLCWFCGCHTKHTLKYAPVRGYVERLLSEIEQVAQRIGRRSLLGHLHFGGGSPSMVRREDFERIAHALDRHFVRDETTEIGIEIDPTDFSAGTMDGFRAVGMNRASIGVQDFDPAVQAAINRPQGFSLTRDVVEELRRNGVSSVNIDALYGLPLQTSDRLRRTLEQVVALSPDRIALFGYAHVPWMKKHQRLINESDLPGPVQRYRHAAMAGGLLADAGYLPIGIDHFAKPTDPLALACASGRLRRNFQGYTTDACVNMIGIGASAIGAFEGGYVQNMVAIRQYEDAVDAGRRPIARGRLLGSDDRIRRWMIERLMCDFGMDFAALRARFGDDGAAYVEEARSVAANDPDGLFSVTSDGLALRPEARALARIAASRFDAYLNEGRTRYSQAV